MSDDVPGLERLPLAHVLLLEAACRRFEAAWQAAPGPEDRPQVDAYLDGLPESARPILRSELEALEQELRALGRPAGPPASDLSTQRGTRNDVRPSRVPDGPVDEVCIPGYDVMEELGHGGMAVVYRALNIKLKRIVALKLIHGGGRWERGSVARFWAEAEVTASIRHPHVVQVYELGEYDGRPYMALEYVAGGTLADRLKRDPRLPPMEAAALAAKIARGVSAAHDLHVVHRDLKPGNILLDTKGQPKVSDFGLAKRAVSDLTHTHVLMGTPAYMSPEQAGRQAKFVTPAADVWAIGVILYECLTGRCPFVADQTDSLLSKIHLESPRSPRRLVPGLPRDLELICLRCLEKDPRRRYQSAGELAADLDRFLEGRPVSVRPPSLANTAVRWAVRNPALAAAIAAAVLALLGGSAASTAFGLRASDRAGLARTEAARAEHEAEEARLQTEKTRLALLANLRLLGLMNADEGAKLADEGRLAIGLLRMAYPLAVAADCPEAVEMARHQFAGYIRNTMSGYRLETVVTHSDAVNKVEFSPDGLWFVTASADKTARVWDVASGRPISPPLQHEGPVNTAVFSPDGRMVLTASNDGTARIWDARTGSPMAPPLEHGGWVESAAFRPDGRVVVTASRDRLARVWDAESGRQLGASISHGHFVFAAVFSSDGRRVITASSDNTARVSDATTGKSLTPPLRHSDGVYAAVFSPDGRRVLTGSRDGAARLWDAETGQPATAPLVHDGSVGSICFSSDGRRVATASEDRTARVWDSRTGRAITPPLRHNNRVLSAAFSPDGRRVLTTSYDGSARVWDAESGKPLSAAIQHALSVNSGRFSPDGRRLATAASDRTARIWVAECPTLPERSLPDYPVDAFAMSPDERRVITGSRNGFARILDLSTGSPLAPPLPHADPISSVAFSPDGLQVLTASMDRTARVWDAATGHPTGSAMRHDLGVNSAVFSPDGRWVATASEDGAARVWDAATGGPRTPPLRHSATVFWVVFSPDGRWVATASRDGTARVWDAATGTAATPPLVHAQAVRRIAFSPDGRRVVTVSSDYTARVWDAVTGVPLTPPLRHALWVYSAAFSLDGRFIVTASADRTARVWQADTGKIVSPPIAHSDPVYSAAFSPDGNQVLTSSENVARVWSAQTGRPLTPPLRHNTLIISALFLQDGRRVLSVSADGVVRIWDLEPDERPAADILREAELMSSHRIDSTGGLVPLTAEDTCRHWEDLRRMYPAAFAPGPVEVRCWRDAEIRACMREGNLAAAKFHHWALVYDLATTRHKP